MITKIQSLQNLETWSFNTPCFIRYYAGLVGDDLKILLPSKTGYGLRTSAPGLTSGPFHYNINASEAAGLAYKYHEDYDVIISEYIPAAWSVLSGHLTHLLGAFYLEYFTGSGVVRDLEKKVPKQFTFVPGAVLPHESLTQVLKDFKDLQTFAQISPLVLEFSIHDRPCGQKNESVVYWEYREY